MSGSVQDGRRRGHRCRPAGVFAGILALVVTTSAAAAIDDRHAGYYYPEPQTVEVYTARAQTLIDSNRTRRIGFTVELTQQMLKNPYFPEFTVFAKGTEAEKLIIVAMQDGVIDTLFRARALLAMLTAVARATPLFRDFGVADSFTFFDLLKILGFEQLTISDGDTFAHQVEIE